MGGFGVNIIREPTAAAAAPILANAPTAAPVSAFASANASQDWTKLLHMILIGFYEDLIQRVWLNSLV
nr:hypothetical protein CFP56_56807 [Quercus suber]